MNKCRIKWLSIAVVLFVLLVSVACNPIAKSFWTATGEKAVVDSVDIATTGGQPPRYVAEVTGYLPDACTELGATRQEVVRTTIQVTMYTRKTDGDVCLQQIVPFQERVVLDVSGLKAGSYAVDVNGTVASFTLAEDH